MGKRENALKELKSLFVVVPIGTEKIFKIKSLNARKLVLEYLKEECQVFEIEEKNGQDVFVDHHIHEDSREIFYQIRGETSFTNGEILRSGEIKVIEPKIPHSFTVKSNSALILIVHPVEKAFIV